MQKSLQMLKLHLLKNQIISVCNSFIKNMILDHIFHINSTSNSRPVKQNQLSFSSININKPLPAPVNSVLQIRFKIKNPSQFLPQIGCLTTLRVDSSIINIDSNIASNINRKVINVQQEKSRTKTGALRNSSIKQIFL